MAARKCSSPTIAVIVCTPHRSNELVGGATNVRVEVIAAMARFNIRKGAAPPEDWRKPLDYEAIERVKFELMESWLQTDNRDYLKASSALELIMQAYDLGVDVPNVLVDAMTPKALMNLFVNEMGYSLNQASQLAAQIRGKNPDSLRRRIRKAKPNKS